MTRRRELAVRMALGARPGEVRRRSTLALTRCAYIPFMKLWVDADAAPRDVKEICFRASERLKLDTVLVANQRIQLPLGYAHLSAVRVDGGPDVADGYIADHAAAGDVAVTANIP